MLDWTDKHNLTATFIHRFVVRSTVLFLVLYEMKTTAFVMDPVTIHLN